MYIDQTGILNNPWEFSLLSTDQITDIPSFSGCHILCVLILLYVRIQRQVGTVSLFFLTVKLLCTAVLSNV